MSSSSSCLAILSLLVLASHLPDAASAPRGIGPLSPAAAAKLVSAVNGVRRQAGPPVAWSATVAQRALRAEWLSDRPKAGATWRTPASIRADRVLIKPIVALTYFVTGGGPGRARGGRGGGLGGGAAVVRRRRQQVRGRRRRGVRELQGHGAAGVEDRRLRRRPVRVRPDAHDLRLLPCVN